MSEKKKPKTWHAEGTHPTNTSRARASESPTAPVGGSYAAASAERSNRAGKPSTFNQPKQSKFIPHDVRVAGFRRDGFTPKEAKRLASYQSSTAGLARADAGEMPDPRNPTGSTFKQPTGASTTPTPTTNTEIVAGAQTAVDPLGVTHTGSAAAGSPQRNFRAAQSTGTMSPEKVAQAHEYAKSIGTTFDEKTGYDRKPFLDKKNKAASVDPEPEAELTESNQPEGGGTASFRMPDGSMRTIGANEDVHDKFKSIRAEDGHLARPGESTSNRAEEPAQSAIEQGDGSVAPPPPVERAALPSPEKNARDVQSVATLEEPASTKPASVPAPKVPTAKDVKAKPVMPLYTGGDAVAKEQARTAKKRADVKAKNAELRKPKLVGPLVDAMKSVVDTVKANPKVQETAKKVGENLDRTKKNVVNIPKTVKRNVKDAASTKDFLSYDESKPAENVANAKKSFSETMTKVKNLPGIKQFREANSAANQRKAVRDGNRNMKHFKGELSAADIKKHEATAKKNGVHFDVKKGFYI